MTAVSLTINSRAVAAEVEPRTHLADFIREAQTLTGTHLGCEHGVCGACTVLLDGSSGALMHHVYGGVQRSECRHHRRPRRR